MGSALQPENRAASRDQARKNLRGIGFMLLAMAAFIVSDTMLKLSRQELQAGQILLIRGVFAILILLTGLAIAHRLDALRLAVRPVLLLRALIEGGVAVLYVVAIGAMALADIIAVLMVSPLLIVGASALFLGEKVGWRRWLAIFGGFAGVLLVLQPGGTAVPFWAGAAAVGSALLVAIRDILTRTISSSISSLSITVTTTCGTTICGGVIMLFTAGWQPVSGGTILALAFAAIFVIIGNYAIIAAHRDVELSVVSPFRFSVILFALAMGVAVFGEVPTPLAFTGMAMIVASGLYAAWREQVRRREAEKAATTMQTP